MIQIEVDLKKLNEQIKQLEGKLSKKPSTLPSLGVLAIGGCIAGSRFPWLHALIHNAVEYEKEQAYKRTLNQD
jgi:hypothetical protein